MITFILSIALLVVAYFTYGKFVERFFGARVDLRRNERGRGRIVVSFGSDEELERIVGLLDQVNGRTK